MAKKNLETQLKEICKIDENREYFCNYDEFLKFCKKNRLLNSEREPALHKVNDNCNCDAFIDNDTVLINFINFDNGNPYMKSFF